MSTLQHNMKMMDGRNTKKNTGKLWILLYTFGFLYFEKQSSTGMNYTFQLQIL